MKEKLTRDEALAALRRLAAKVDYDVEADHVEADAILLRLIDDPEIAKAFNAIEKWYA